MQDEEKDIIYETEEGKAKKPISDLSAEADDTDVVSDDATEENLSAEAGAIVKKLKEQIKTLTKEKQEYMDGWQRERADFTNYKKRMENEKLEVVKYANESLVEELLPVLDSFEMAFANKEVWEKVDKNWRVGVEYIHSQLLKTLGEHGVRELNPMGETFDPKFHVAETHAETTNEAEDGKVVAVKKKGWMLADRVVVAPVVTVAEFKKQ